MHSQRKRLILWISLILSVVSLVAVSAARADEAEPVWRSTWRVIADFDTGQPRVRFRVQVDHRNPEGVWDLFAVHTQLLRCSATPQVGFAGGAAVFNGQGGIRCAMPSVQATVSRLTDGQYVPDDVCPCKGHPNVQADVTLNQNTNPGAEYENPVFVRTVGQGADMSFAVPVRFGSLQPAVMAFQVAGETAASDSFLANQAPNDLLARFLNGGAALQPEFWANGALVGAATGPVESLAVSNLGAALYIGYSPVTGRSLQGALFGLDIDPGCFGSG